MTDLRYWQGLSFECGKKLHDLTTKLCNVTGKEWLDTYNEAQTWKAAYEYFLKRSELALEAEKAIAL